MTASRRARRRSRSGYRQRGRAIEAMACALLQGRGFTVVRSRRYTAGVHLVAWCDWSPPLFIHVRRSRKLVETTTEIVSLWPGEVAALQAVPRWDGMSVQFWIHAGRNYGWQCFEIFPKGVTEVECLVA